MTFPNQRDQRSKGKRNNSPAFFAKQSWLVKAAETKPALNYVAGMTVMDLAAAQAIDLSPLANEFMIVGWNYSDAICSLVVGTAYLLDNDSYNQAQIKAKGIINIFSGLQLLLVTYHRHLIQWGTHALTGLTAFAAPAFALAMFCDMVCAIIDFYKAYKELNYAGWRDERVKEQEFLGNKIKKLAAKGDEISKSEAAKLKSLKEQLKNVTTDIQARDFVNATDAKIKHDVNKRVNDRIQSQMEVNFDKARLNLVLKTASFIGMTILAVASFVSCPPLTIIGMVVCSLVAAGYIYKHGEAIVKAAQRFFTLSQPHTQPEKPLPNLRYQHMDKTTMSDFYLAQTTSPSP